MMARTKRREFPYVYLPGEKLFHLVVGLEDVPGALGEVLDLLRAHVNLLGSISYSLGNGKAVWSGFGRAVSNSENAVSLEKLLLSSKVARECEVKESNEGLLVDSFHSGIETEMGESLILLSREGLSHMFGQVARQFGSGGEVLLYTQGHSLGEESARTFVRLLGAANAAKMVGDLRPILSASGWGIPTRVSESPPGTYTLRMDDCFECSHGKEATKSCSFLRGYLEGSASAILGRPSSCQETRCRRSGDKHCEFVIGPKA